MVQREQDGHTGVRRVNDNFSRAQDFNVWAAQVPDGHGTG